MSIGVFTDKAHPPTSEQILKTIGAKQLDWEELVRFIRDEFAAQAEFKFYGKNYGWAWRFRKRGKALASLYPAADSFVVQVILGKTETQHARALRLGKRVRAIIENAHAFPEGRWLFIPVKSRKDIQDICQLLALKVGARTNKDSA